MVICGLYPSPVLQRSVQQDQMCNTIAFIFNSVAFHAARFHLDRRSHFACTLFGGFIHTRHRIPSIIGSFMNLQHLLHLVNEGGAIADGYAPHPFLQSLDRVILKACRTHSVDILWTISSSTSLCASNRKVQRACPSGASLHVYVLSTPPPLGFTIEFA